MIGGLLRLMREIGGENPVRRDLGRHRIAKSDSRGDRLRDRADAADPRRQRPRFDGRTRLQDLLEAATAAPSPPRAWPAHSRHRGQLRDRPRRVEGTIVKRVMACAWPSGGRAARQRSHSAAPGRGVADFDRAASATNEVLGMSVGSRPECRQALRMSLSTVKREATCSGATSLGTSGAYARCWKDNQSSTCFLTRQIFFNGATCPSRLIGPICAVFASLASTPEFQQRKAKAPPNRHVDKRWNGSSPTWMNFKQGEGRRDSGSHSTPVLPSASPVLTPQ